MPRPLHEASTGSVLLRVLLATTAFFVFARAWVVTIESWLPRAGSPGGGAVLMAALSTALLMLAVDRRARRR